MKKKVVSYIVVCLLIGAILVACGPSQAELEAQATQVAAGLSATQTAAGPTPTSTATATLVTNCHVNIHCHPHPPTERHKYLGPLTSPLLRRSIRAWLETKK